jgi:hypothetical protein
MTALTAIARRLKGRSDDQLAADVARLESELGAANARRTIEDAADAGRSWAGNMRGPLQERANFAAVAADSRDPTFDVALEIVACFVIEHPTSPIGSPAAPPTKRNTGARSRVPTVTPTSNGSPGNWTTPAAN